MDKYEILAKKDTQILQEEKPRAGDCQARHGADSHFLTCLRGRSCLLMSSVSCAVFVSKIATLKDANMREPEIADDRTAARLACRQSAGDSRCHSMSTRRHCGGVKGKGLVLQGTLSLSTAALSSITVKADDAAAALHLTQWIETNSMDDDSPPLVGEKEKRA